MNSNRYSFVWALALSLALLAAMLLLLTPAARAQNSPDTEPVAQTDFSPYELVTLPTGVMTYSISNLVVDPEDDFQIYLATSSGLFHSQDAGDTWSRVATDTLPSVSQMAIASGDTNRLYAWSSGSYQSEDGGETWQAVSRPAAACGFTIAPTDPDILYAYTCWGTAGVSFFRSGDGGITWTTPDNTFTNTLFSVAVSPENPDIIVAASTNGILRSIDAGKTWRTTLSNPAGYYGSLVFETHPPYTLYLGHGGGLLRSTDGGQTWQESDLNRSLQQFILSPWPSQELLGGGNDSLWQISTGESTWEVQPWLAPAPLLRVWSGLESNRVTYVLTPAGIWRHVLPTLDQKIYLAAVMEQDSHVLPSSPAEIAIEHLNLFREYAGVPAVVLHMAAVVAAQNHVDYHLSNSNQDQTAWLYGPHGEVDGKPDFTGIWPWDRMKAAGFPASYPWWGGGEVMHYIGDPLASVEGWIATIYHRVIPLDPGKRYAGYAWGKNDRTVVDVMDFGSGPTGEGVWTSALPYPLAYPSNGLTGVPVMWDGWESPPAIPENAARPVGYPFTLLGIRGKLAVTFAEMRDENNQLVTVYENPQDLVDQEINCEDFNCYAMIPTTPLQANMRYTVRIVGSVEGTAFDRTWTFTTGNASASGKSSSPADK